MATLRNKRKLAAVTRETQEELPRNGQSWNTSVPRINEEFITQVSEEIEGRVTKKLSQEYSRTESRVLGALSKLDEFLLNQQIRTHSGTVLETFRNTNVDNQGTNEDDSQSVFHPETGLFRNQTTQNFGPEVGPYMVTGATKRHDMVTRVTEEVRNGPDIVARVEKESLCSHDMVIGVTKEVRNGHYMVAGGPEEIRFRPHMATEVQEEICQYSHMTAETQEDILYCSPSTSSGKQKRARSTSQPQFRSENTPATIEADQILSALQQLVTNSNSDNFNNKISRISKLPKSLTTKLPTFDGKSEKFELFEDLFQTNLKIHNQLTEEDKIYYLHSIRRGDALPTFKNIGSPNRENLTEILTVFRRKYVKPQSMVTAKHKFQQLVFNPANQKLIDFFGRTPEIGKRCFRSCCPSSHWAIHIFQYASTPEEINKPGPFGERHVWTDCDTPRKGIRATQFGISW